MSVVRGQAFNDEDPPESGPSSWKFADLVCELDLCELGRADDALDPILHRGTVDAVSEANAGAR